jgi:hypothetical protein
MHPTPRARAADVIPNSQPISLRNYAHLNHVHFSLDAAGSTVLQGKVTWYGKVAAASSDTVRTVKRVKGEGEDV